MPKLRLDFWNKDYYTQTAFGRTLSGRNKAGQTIGVVKDTALSVVPFIGKPLTQATGRITKIIEAKEIQKDIEQLNLSKKTIMIIRIVTIAVLGYLVLNNVIGWDEAKQLFELLEQAGV